MPLVRNSSSEPLLALQPTGSTQAGADQDASAIAADWRAQVSRSADDAIAAIRRSDSGGLAVTRLSGSLPDLREVYEDLLEQATLDIANLTGGDPEQIRARITEAARQSVERAVAHMAALKTGLVVGISQAAAQVSRSLETLDPDELRALARQPHHGQHDASLSSASWDSISTEIRDVPFPSSDSPRSSSFDDWDDAASTISSWSSRASGSTSHPASPQAPAFGMRFGPVPDGRLDEALVASVLQQLRKDDVNPPHLARFETDPADSHQKVKHLAQHLQRVTERALQQFKLEPSRYGLPHMEGLQKAAVALVAYGIDTPSKADKLLADARRHDDKVAMATGAVGQLGYGAGMGGFAYGLAPKIVRQFPSDFLGSSGFGAVAGLLVGYLDSVAGSAASRLRAALTYQGGGAPDNLAARDMHLSTARQIGTATGISAGSTFVKNLILRAAIPSVVYAAAFPQGVSRDVRDGIDFAGDAGGAFISGGIADVMKRRALDSRESTAFKLLSQTNFVQVLERMHKPLDAQDIRNALVEYGKGALTGLVAPSTMAVTLGVITPMVGLLIGINKGAIPPGLGVTVDMGKRIYGVLTSTAPDGMTTPAQAAELPILAAEHLVKALISTTLMAGLAGGATAVGNVVGRAADQVCLEGLMNCVRRAVRGDEAASNASAIEMAERGTQDPSSMPRRRRTGDNEVEFG